LSAPSTIGAAVAFAASALNSIAGGGTFLAFPTLTGVLGLSEKTANATCTVGLWPGFAAGIAAARNEFAALERRAIGRLALVSAVGGALGGAMLLLTPAGLFREVVPILLGAGTIFFMAGPAVTHYLNRPNSHDAPATAAMPILLGISIYNGYFGAGGGVLAMAGLSATGMHDPRRANLFKTINQFASNAAAVAVLSYFGVAWPVARGMWIGALAGGWFGMRIANITPRPVLRVIVITSGTILTIVYGWKAYG